MNAQVTVETINPKTAAEWLDNKWEEQRPISQNHVARLASEIRNGKFRLTCDAIALIKGRLANGQHRLAAIVEAEKGAQFIVMRSNDDELYKVIDCGNRRRVSDALINLKNASIVAAAARLIMSYDRDFIASASDTAGYESKNPITRSNILDFIAKNQEKLSEQAHTVVCQYKGSRILAPTIGTAFLHIASRKHAELAAQFIKNVYSGETIDASKDFRDRMIRQMGTRSRLRQSYVFALLIKAWKSFKNGTRPGSLKMADGEEFPEI